MDALVRHLLDHSVRTGDFTLKSGRKSSWFIDSKQTVCRPEGLLLWPTWPSRPSPPDANAVGGLTVGADPVAFGSPRWPPPGAVTCGLHHPQGGQGPRRGRTTGRRPRTGDRVVVTEDTVTRGTSPLEAARVVRELGATPVMILVVVDRGGTCAALAEAEGIAFHALVTAGDLGFDYEGA